MTKYYLPFIFLFVISGCGNPSAEYSPNTASEDVTSTSLLSDATGVTVTNASSAGTEIPNNVTRTYLDFSSYKMVRAQFASSLTSATIRCRIDFSIDNGGTWNTLVSPFAATPIANANNNSGWVDIPQTATTGVLVRAVILGDGALDPIIRYVRLAYY